MYCTVSRSAGVRESERAIFMPSTALSIMVISPCKLSIMVVDISVAAPSQSRIAPDSFSTSAGAAFMRASQPEIAFVPAIILPYEVCCSSFSPCHFSRVSAITSPKSRAEPSALKNCTPSFSVSVPRAPRLFPEAPASVESLVIMERSAVPALVAFMPLFAMRPIISAVSSME